MFARIVLEIIGMHAHVNWHTDYNKNMLFQVVLFNIEHVKNVKWTKWLGCSIVKKQFYKNGNVGDCNYFLNRLFVLTNINKDITK